MRFWGVNNHVQVWVWIICKVIWLFINFKVRKRLILFFNCCVSLSNILYDVCAFFFRFVVRNLWRILSFQCFLNLILIFLIWKLRINFLHLFKFRGVCKLLFSELRGNMRFWGVNNHVQVWVWIICQVIRLFVDFKVRKRLFLFFICCISYFYILQDVIAFFFRLVVINFWRILGF